MNYLLDKVVVEEATSQVINCICNTCPVSNLQKQCKSNYKIGNHYVLAFNSRQILHFIAKAFEI